MTKLSKRLRACAATSTRPLGRQLCGEAADEIDLLTRTLQSAKEDFELFAAQYDNPDMRETAVAIGAQLRAAGVAS